MHCSQTTITLLGAFHGHGNVGITYIIACYFLVSVNYKSLGCHLLSVILVVDSHQDNLVISAVRSMALSFICWCHNP